MRIAIIGAGRIGATLARLFAGAGHAVALSNSRGPASLAQLVAEIGGEVRAETPAVAAEWAEVILLAVPWTAWEGILAPRDAAGKIVIDAMNRFSPDAGGPSAPGSSELVAERLTGASVVKAFNTMHWQDLATGGGAELAERRALFVAGDDARARTVAVGLIEEIGFAAVVTGGLRAGGALQQPGAVLFNRPMWKEEAERTLAAQPAATAP